eukprot:scaffold35156_cov22-Phaeocystis_antarctica.AAC.1
MSTGSEETAETTGVSHLGPNANPNHVAPYGLLVDVGGGHVGAADVAAAPGVGVRGRDRVGVELWFGLG